MRRGAAAGAAGAPMRAEGLGILAQPRAGRVPVPRAQSGEHRLAQQRGRSDWYAHYELRIARVERAHSRGG